MYRYNFGLIPQLNIKSLKTNVSSVKKKKPSIILNKND